jgi:methanethiol S-methyltransferase
MKNYYLLLVIYWAAYLAMHSLLATLTVKSIAKRIMGTFFSYYRVIYIIVSTIPLIFIGAYILSGEPEWIFKGNIITLIIAVMLAVSGIVVISKSFRTYSLREFIGLSYLTATEHGNEKLRTSGILSIVRHPLYTGTILVFAGYFVSIPSISNLITLVCVFLYLIIGIGLEERKLIAEFGADYSEYRNRVPMLFPAINPLKWIKKHQKN